MKKISFSLLFAVLAVAFVLVAFGIAMKERKPIDLPACYEEIICDPASLLNAEQRAQLEGIRSILLESYNIDMRLLVADTNEGETLHYFKTARVGEKSPSGMGVLLMADTKDKMIRFQSTIGMNSIFPVEFIAFLEREQSNQYLSSGQFALGFLTSAEAVARRAKQASENIPFRLSGVPTGEVSEPASTDVNNEPQAAAGQFAAPEARPHSSDVPPQPEAPSIIGTEKTRSPQVVYDEYQRILLSGNRNYDLPIYALNAQAMLKAALRTPAQLEAERRIYQNCKIYKENIINQGLGAVILFDIQQRKCAPHFFIFENGEWRLDLVARSNHIIIDDKGEWRLNMSKPLFYADGLLDWNFNADGYPQARPPARWGWLFHTDDLAKVTFIKKIFDGSLAAALPLQEKDVILKWGELEKPTADMLVKALEETPTAQVIPVIFWRNGQTYQVDITAPSNLN